MFFMLIEQKIAKSLLNAQITLSIAESCTGGLLSHRLTNIPGSSGFLKLAIIVYSDDSKVKLLKIPIKILRRYGAVSSQAAMLMAKNVRAILRTDFGIGITGIAGPTGATSLKPIGLTYIAVATTKKSLCVKYHFMGSRQHIKRQAATRALKLLKKFLT